jgi:hypothetical protein
MKELTKSKETCSETVNFPLIVFINKLLLVQEWVSGWTGILLLPALILPSGLTIYNAAGSITNAPISVLALDTPFND